MVSFTLKTNKEEPLHCLEEVTRHLDIEQDINSPNCNRKLGNEILFNIYVLKIGAGCMGFEPMISAVTGQRLRPLDEHPSVED